MHTFFINALHANDIYTMLYEGAIKHANLKQGIVLMPPPGNLRIIFFLIQILFSQMKSYNFVEL